MNDTLIKIPEWLWDADGREIEFHCPQESDNTTGYVGTSGLGKLVIKLYDNGFGTAEILVRSNEMDDIGNLLIRHLTLNQAGVDGISQEDGDKLSLIHPLCS